MDEHSWQYRIIGPSPPLWAHPLRWALRGAEVLYARAVAARNARYDRSHVTQSSPIPVISVGNITVGGTGKTPLVIDLVRRLLELRYRPAVVSRGYKSIDGVTNDEQRLIQDRFPGIICLSDVDRARACQIASGKLGANVIILDDGFQHRRVRRALDIVLVDATCPFGYGHLLPRGLLREPVESLNRADVVVITRADQVPNTELERIESRVKDVTTNAAIIRCNHVVSSVEGMNGEPAAFPLEGKRAVLFAGIGRPGAFSATARSLSINVVAQRWWPDHHHYTQRDIQSLERNGSLPPHDFLLTTEKDAVKLRTLAYKIDTPILVVKVEIDFVSEDCRMLQLVLEETLRSVTT